MLGVKMEVLRPSSAPLTLPKSFAKWHRKGGFGLTVCPQYLTTGAHQQSYTSLRNFVIYSQ